MGTLTWPCKGCGQQQKKEIQAGEEIETLPLCAACQEEKEFAEILDGESAEGKKGKKEKHAHEKA